MRLKVGDIFRNISNGMIIAVTKISVDNRWSYRIVYAAYITHEGASRTVIAAKIAEAEFDTSILGRYWEPVEI